MENGIKSAVEYGRYRDMSRLVRQELENGSAAGAVLGDILDAMEQVGSKYQNGKNFVSDMIVSPLAAKRGIEVLEPYLREMGAGASQVRGTVILGTAPGGCGKSSIRRYADAVLLTHNHTCKRGVPALLPTPRVLC